MESEALKAATSSITGTKSLPPPLLSKNVHAKYAIKSRVPPLLREGSPLKATCSNSYFLHLTRTWDQGNRTTRQRILKDFIQANLNKTRPQLEKELNNGASLFLTRITAWLRLTYLLGQNIALILEAINIFIAASSGSRFLAEFLEVGGVLTVLEILGITQAREADKAEALRVLIFIAGNGRKYKEFICESYGVRLIGECLTKSKSEVTQDYARNLLYQLGTGNPKFVIQVYKSLLAILNSQSLSPTALQMASQALRMLLPNVNALPPSIVESSINLVRHSDVQVQYEGYELLKDLIRRASLQDQIIRELIVILRVVPITEESEESDGSRRRKTMVETKLTNTGLMIKDEQKNIQSLNVQQTYAAKLLSFAAATSRETAEKMVLQQVIGALLNTIANVGHLDSQRYATNLLLYLAQHFDYVMYGLCDQMGNNFFDLIESKPDTFYRDLTKDQVKYLRRNNVKITENYRTKTLESDKETVPEETATDGRKSVASAAMFPSALEEEEGIALEYSENNDFGSDILVDETKSILVDEYENSQKNMEKQLVETIYTPFVQKNITTTYASANKYSAPGALDAQSKFANDLDQLKIKQSKDKKIPKKKEEFTVELDKELEHKLTFIQKETSFAKKNTAVTNQVVPVEIKLQKRLDLGEEAIMLEEDEEVEDSDVIIEESEDAINE